jgi:plastocyanin
MIAAEGDWMRKTFLAMALLLAATTVLAQEHEHAMSGMAMDETPEQHLATLRAYLKAHSVHGPVIPQPEAVTAAANVAITITGKSFLFSPASFTVNQGDVVTLTLTVPSNDASKVGHGLLMETYLEANPLETKTGGTASRTFTATTAGEFLFICSVSDCGTGHTSMIGKMIVTKAAAAAPSISTISPVSGSTAGGTAVTINGSGFGSNATVTFGGVAATNVTVNTSTSITATAPAHAAGKVDVVVTNSDSQTGTLAQSFTYAAPLAITTITPNVALPAGTPGAAATTITITGTGFNTSQVPAITVGGVAATNVQVNDSTTLRATVPLHAAGSGDVKVTFGSASVTVTNGFLWIVPTARHRAGHH